MRTRYGRWTRLDPTQTGAYVDVQCDCGTLRHIQRSKLEQEQTLSCGCRRGDLLRGHTWPKLAPESESDAGIVPGSRRGRWTVLEVPEPSRNRRALCRCDCGTEKNVLVAHLRSGRSKSCGCLRREGARIARQATPRSTS